MRRAVLALSVMLWTVAVGGGAAALTRYAHRPGAPATAPRRWPVASTLPRGDGPTLVVIVHPLCPCSRATIGIAPEHRQRVFELFQRLHRDEYPGTGIGLSICKRVVEGAGGRIWIEDTPGGGTTMRFALPAA